MNNIDEKLCVVVNEIIEREWFFLLDVNYPWELLERSCDLEEGSLVISRVKQQDGFFLLKSISMRSILHKQTPFLPYGEYLISDDEKQSFINDLVRRVPKM